MFVQIPDEAHATGEVAAYFAAQREFWGFLPNYAACFSTRPDVAQAWNALNGAVRGGMDRRRFEIATIAAARERRSTYCAVAHSKFLRDVCGDGATVQAIADDPTGGRLGEQDRAVFTFATKVARDPASVQQSDVDAVRSAGLSDAEVIDVVFAVAARLFFTTVLDGLGAQLDRETAEEFEPGLRDGMLVGRSPAT